MQNGVNIAVPLIRISGNVSTERQARGRLPTSIGEWILMDAGHIVNSQKIAEIPILGTRKWTIGRDVQHGARLYLFTDIPNPYSDDRNSIYVRDFANELRGVIETLIGLT